MLDGSSLCTREHIRLAKIACSPTLLIKPAQTKLRVSIKVIRTLSQHSVDDRERSVNCHGATIGL